MNKEHEIGKWKFFYKSYNCSRTHISIFHFYTKVEKNWLSTLVKCLDLVHKFNFKK